MVTVNEYDIKSHKTVQKVTFPADVSSCRPFLKDSPLGFHDRKIFLAQYFHPLNTYILVFIVFPNEFTPETPLFRDVTRNAHNIITSRSQVIPPPRDNFAHPVFFSSTVVVRRHRDKRDPVS